MISITVESLERQHISLKKRSEFLLDGVTFTKKLVVSKKHKRDAMNLIEEYGANHLKAILIEHKLFFSVWLEKVTTSTQTNTASNKLTVSTNAIAKNLETPDVLDVVDDAPTLTEVFDNLEVDALALDADVDESKKPISLLDDRKMVEARLDLDNLLSSKLQEFGL